MPVTVGENIRLFLGPQSAAPSSSRLDDLEAAIVDFIDGAAKRLDIAVQELESRPITEAILRAEIERKVRVRLVLEADYLTAKRPPKTVAEAFESHGAEESNRLLAAAAMRATAWVRADFNPDIFHQKFIIRDGSAVLTGSTNFTPTGVGKAPGGGNLNHVLTVQSRALARVYQKEFDQISHGIFGMRSELTPRPNPVVVDGVTFKVCFAPEHSPEMEIAKQINKAQDRIDFAIFTFAQSSGIDDALKMAIRARVKVSGVMDAMQANQKWAAAKGLLAAGARLWSIEKSAGRVNKLHHKLMVIDDRAMVLGSFNYTHPANALNDENVVVIYCEDGANAALPMIEAARDEISRIKRWHGEPMTG